MSVRNFFHRGSSPLRLSDFLSSRLSISRSTVQEMISLGSVYLLSHRDYDVAKHKEMNEENLSTFALSSSSSVKLKRSLMDVELQSHDFVKVYLQPKRYPVANLIDWRSRLLAVSSHFLVLDKPEGVPSHALIDNFRENVVEKLRENINEIDLKFEINSLEEEDEEIRLRSLDYFKYLTEEKLEALRQRNRQRLKKKSNKILSPQDLSYRENFTLPQRLDTDTGGLLLVSRSAKAANRLGKLLLDKKINKKYHALLAVQIEEQSPLLSAESRGLSLELSEGRLSILPHLKKKAKEEERLLSFLHPGQILTGYLKPSPLSPKIYSWSKSDDENLLTCQLRIQNVSKLVYKSRNEWKKQFKTDQIEENPLKQYLDTLEDVQNISTNVSRKLSTENFNSSKLQLAMKEWMEAGEGEDRVGFIEIQVSLITGRTHQIRGQVQSLQSLKIEDMTVNSPENAEFKLLGHKIHLAGDRLYPGATSKSFSRDHSYICPYLCLKCSELSITLEENHTLNFTAPPPWWNGILTS